MTLADHDFEARRRRLPGVVLFSSVPLRGDGVALPRIRTLVVAGRWRIEIRRVT